MLSIVTRASDWQWRKRTLKRRIIMMLPVSHLCCFHFPGSLGPLSLTVLRPDGCH